MFQEQTANQSTSEQPYQAAPQHPNNNHRFSTVPPGWTTATDHSDGRIFYLETATGRTSWTHPHATNGAVTTTTNTPRSPPIAVQGTTTPAGPYDPNNNTKTHQLDTPLNATRRPDPNQCYALVSCLLFPPLGIIALVHSFLTDRAWKQGRYSDAVGHAREAPKYAGFAVCVGIAFWIWWLFLRREAEGVEWLPDWDFHFGE